MADVPSKPQPTKPKPKKTDLKLKTFALVGGPHYGPDYDAEPQWKVTDPETGDGYWKFPTKKYEKSDNPGNPTVVLDVIDLTDKCPNKFIAVTDWQMQAMRAAPAARAAKPMPAGLELMSVKQLQDLAEENEIEVPANAKREDLLKLIKGALGS